MNRVYVEKILKLNGLSPEDPTDKIASFFQQIRWRDDDIKKALATLNDETESSSEETTQKKSAEDECHHKKGADQGYDTEHYSPEKIQSLLNIQLDASELNYEALCADRKNMSLGQVLLIVILSASATAAAFVFVDWYYEIDFLTYLR